MSDFAFSGLNLAITTPYDEKGRVDYAVLERNVERYLEAGISSFVLSSGTGMHVYLSHKESLELIERGARMIDGRATIIAQTSALLVEDVLERTRRAKESGADGIMVLPPFFEGPMDDRGILDFYAEVASGGLPVIGYNVPQAVGVAITPELLDELFKIPGFCGVKDSSGDFWRLTSLIRTERAVINGSDCFMPYALYAGARGVIWGGANAAPRTSLALIAAANAGKWDQVREIWAVLEPFMSLIWEGEYVQKVYAAAELTGYGAGAPRKPLRALPAENMRLIRETLGELMVRERP